MGEGEGVCEEEGEGGERDASLAATSSKYLNKNLTQLLVSCFAKTGRRCRAGTFVRPLACF